MDKKTINKNKNFQPLFHPLYIQRREIPWEKVPFVPRPSLIADPITAFGRRKPKQEDLQRREGSIVSRLNREIKAKPEMYLRPLEDIRSPREQTRDKVYNEIRHHQRIRESGGLTTYFTDNQSLDVILPRLHGKSAYVPAAEHRRPYLPSCR